MQTSEREWATTASLKWLQEILYERWGNSGWIFNIESPGVVGLRLTSKAKKIIQFSGGCFPPGTSNIPCGLWRIQSPFSGVLNDELLTPGLEFPRANLIVDDNEKLHVHYDIPGLIFWMLTRSEELGRKDLDQFGRFPGSASHAKKNGYLQRPLVDEWLHILFQIIDRTWPGAVAKKVYPSLALSHDVDIPSRYAFVNFCNFISRMGGDLLIRHEPFNMLKAPISRVKSKNSISKLDPHNQFDWMMDVAELAGLPAAFYFICGRSNLKYDADYEIEHPAIRNLLREIHNRGHEIGLHPSFESFKIKSQLILEAERLRNVCCDEGIVQSSWGGRMHYLRWSHPATLRILVAAGQAYDSTLGYADEPGFRCGTCFEYPAFDPVADESLPIRLRPLIAMEASVIEPSYLNLGTDAVAFDYFMELKRTCTRIGGTFNLLWHNSSLTNSNQRHLYKSIVLST